MLNQIEMRGPARKLTWENDRIAVCVLAALGLVWFIYFGFIDQF